MKVVLNAGVGGFGISQLCAEFMAERGYEIAQKVLNHKNSF